MTLEFLKSKTKDLTGYTLAFARQTSANGTGFGQSRFCENLSGLD